MRSADAAAVRSLQSLLAYAEPQLVDAAIDGPFVGRVAVDGAIVGYAIAFPGDEATLSELVVTPNHRRSGYGQALVAAISERLAADRLFVTTPAENETARRFYADIGFEVEKRLPEFYADGANGLRLVRPE